MFLALALGAGAASWRRLPGIDELHLAAWHPGGVAYLDRAGAMWLHDGERPALLAAAGPEVSRHHLACGDDGRCWVLQNHPPTIQRLEPRAASWSAPEPLGDGLLSRVLVAPGGQPWIEGTFLAPRVLLDRGWVRIDGLGDGAADVAPLGDGEAWAANRDGRLVHLVGDRVASAHPVPRGVRELALGADRRPVFAIAASIQRLEGDARALEATPAEMASRASGWLALVGDTLLVEGERPLPLPSTAENASVLSGSDDRVYVAAAGAVYQRADEPGPLLRDVAARAGVPAAGDRAWPIDDDADGLADLVLGLPGAPPLFLRQTPGGSALVASASPGAALPADPADLIACDLDGDGDQDLLAVVSTGGGGRALHYLQQRTGHWVDVSEREALVPPHPVVASGRGGRLSCVDTDLDGDLDVFYAAGTEPPEGQPGLAHWTNTGAGRLALSTLGDPGLGSARSWPRRVLGHERAGGVDLVVQNFWGTGHQLFRLEAGRLLDLTRGSGLDGYYAADGFVARRDLDGDGISDLLAIGEATHAWKGRPDGRFDERTAAWGLGARWGALPAAIGEFTGDGLPDLVRCGGEEDCQFLQGKPGGGFEHLPGALPEATAGATGLATFDLGGDGDEDLLVLRAGGHRLFENVGAAGGRVPAPVVRGSVATRARWLAPWPDGALALVAGLAWAAGGARARRQGSRLFLGRRWVAMAMGSAAAALAALDNDRSLGVRLLLVAPLALAGLGLGEWERRAEIRRWARRISGYRLRGLLGQGGMGRVYDAIDEDSGTAVAVKLVEPTLLNTDADRALYRQEARACAAIRDPRVVRVLAYGEWHDARPGRGTTAWLAMERLHGRTLQRVLAGGPLPLGVACHVMSELCLALAAVDEAGLVHRDVKPGNIMVLATGAVKLMDFGAALSADAAGPRVVLGTPGYLAPEQALGAPPVAASDLFAAGVVAYEMLAGRRPFAARGLDGYLAALATPPPPLPPHTPPELARAVAACLAHDPGSRPARPRELAATFAVHATRPPPTPEAPAPVVRSEAGAFALWRLWSSYRSREPDATVEGFARWVVAQSTPPPPLARPVETWLADPVPPGGGETVPPEEEA